MSCLGCKHQPCRVFPVPHGQRIHLDADFPVSNGRADLQHMGFQDSFLARNQVICIILHKGGALRVLHALGHDFHQPNHGGRLPVAFPAESVAFFHQPLDGQAGKLLQLS